MSGTKIINVLRSDKFEDILDIFRKTPAKEVIFVLPKKSKAFASEDSFAKLAEESRGLDKAVLILSESQEINSIASSHNFAILTNEGNEGDDGREEMDHDEVALEDSDADAEPTETARDEINMVETPAGNNEPEPSYLETEKNYDEKIMPEHSNEAIFTAAPKIPRSLEDIVQPETKKPVSVKIGQNIETPSSVEVKKEFRRGIRQTPSEKASIDEIKNVWQAKRSAPEKIYDGPAPGFKLPGFPIGKWASNLSKKTIYLYGFAVLIIFSFVLYVSLGKAEVIIKAAAYPFDSSFKVMASDSFLSIDPNLKRIPGQLFSIDKRVEETFQATGEKDVVQKAKGIITVYNEYGTSPQILIATTRFESSDGVIFRTLKTITVPGTRVQNGSIIPGKIDVEVIADKAGDSYNISPGKFTIPGFKEKGDNDRYTKFYGQSTVAMKGGIIGKAKVVTEKDYNDAKSRIQEKIVSEAEAELKNQAGNLKIINLPKPEVKDITSSAQVDEAVDSFVVSANAAISTVGFKEEDLNSLIIKYAQNLNNVEVLPEKLDIKFNDVNFDKDQKILSFTVSVKGPVYGKIDQDKIITGLMGRGEDSIKEYVKSLEGVSSAKVVLSPFWVMKVPKDQSRIKIQIEYGDLAN